MTLTPHKRYRCFGGLVEYHEQASTVCNSLMRFSVYRPPQADKRSVPLLYWLSGLTCTEENVMAKSGIQKYAAQHGIMVVAPDTSPRNTGIADEDTDWDLGSGAGFYLNATTKKWSKHYNMYDYVTKELRELIAHHFPVQSDNISIMGHSMGGHGALICALKNPGLYKSCSAFAPICAPTQCPWGQKAFQNYLGDDQQEWSKWDAHLLISQASAQTPILIDQGGNDEFLTTQLMPDKLQTKVTELQLPLEMRMQEGYDHSYYFVASFIEEHIKFHASHLIITGKV